MKTFKKIVENLRKEIDNKKPKCRKCNNPITLRDVLDDKAKRIIREGNYEEWIEHKECQ